jgi:hypothetical protein
MFGLHFRSLLDTVHKARLRTLAEQVRSVRHERPVSRVNARAGVIRPFRNAVGEHFERQVEGIYMASMFDGLGLLCGFAHGCGCQFRPVVQESLLARLIARREFAWQGANGPFQSCPDYAFRLFV